MPVSQTAPAAGETEPSLPFPVPGKIMKYFAALGASDDGARRNRNGEILAVPAVHSAPAAPLAVPGPEHGFALVRKTIFPPLPPSPPSGPPRGTYFSRRKEVLPAPPSPERTSSRVSSTNADMESDGYGPEIGDGGAQAMMETRFLPFL